MKTEIDYLIQSLNQQRKEFVHNLQSSAKRQTTQAKEKLAEIDGILLYALNTNNAVNWEILKYKEDFNVPNPKNKIEDELKSIPIPNNFIRPEKKFFQPKLSFADRLVKSKREKKTTTAASQYTKALEEYNIRLSAIERKKNEIIKKYEDWEKEWENQKKEYYKNQERHNLSIDDLKGLYMKGDANAVIEYCGFILNNSEYPVSFPKNFDIEYNKDNHILLVEYMLPALEHFPRLSEVKYIATKSEWKEIYISERQFSKMYDTAIYNICLRTLYELFVADDVNAIDIIVFNGWVDTINEATGKKMTNCIVSIQVSKTEFTEIELANIDPKACFKNLKGINSSKLSGITAIQPLIQANKADKRFVASYNVSNKLDEGFNLASMDWEDFEHLIRELFEKEFSSNGGEVKVTQASRDGGVDAIAFDPDPIRGGKIVIQAKRYTNTVGVSSVRDLYGTVMNEGATKGILVTTADYGPDAYEFVRNKPLTLLNGSNLLFLLEKHGQKARIDINEAKRIQAER